MTTLSIIILNHNTSKLLQRALSSIKSSLSAEVIVVDNASTDDSLAMIDKHFPKVKKIISTKNLGFAAGNNLGLKQARGKYLMLLNSDTKIIKNSLETLITYLEDHPKVGIVGPKLLLPDGAIDLACHRGFPTPTNSLAYFSHLESLFPESKLFFNWSGI